MIGDIFTWLMANPDKLGFIITTLGSLIVAVISKLGAKKKVEEADAKLKKAGEAAGIFVEGLGVPFAAIEEVGKKHPVIVKKIKKKVAEAKLSPAARALTDVMVEHARTKEPIDAERIGNELLGL